MKLCALFALLCSFCLAQSVEFVHLTDTHVMQMEGIHPALVPLRLPNVLSAAQLEKFLAERRPQPPAFFLHTGDILEAFRYDGESGAVVHGQMERFQALQKLSPAPMYLALGNRDVSWYRQAAGKQVVVRDAPMAAEARTAWRGAFECFRNGTWYSFEQRAGAATYLFAVLDNGVTTDPEFVRAQLAWLRKLLAGARPTALVLAMHIPLGDDAFSQAVEEILRGLARPALVLAGHRHTDGVEEISASPRRVQVRTASFTGGKSCSRRVVLRPEGIDVYTTNEPDKPVLTIPVGDAR